MNQFRDNFRPSFIDKINTYYYKFRGAKIGNNSWIQFPAKLERNIRNIHIKDNVIVKPGSRICCCNKEATITIDSNCSIGHYSFIYSSIHISVGNNVMIAPFCYIVDSNHEFKLGRLLVEQENVTSSITIQDDIWIGQNSMILSGSFISTGSVIGAKSLVNGKTEMNGVYVGSPVKLVKFRQ